MPCSSENPICSHRKKKSVLYNIYKRWRKSTSREGKRNQSMGLKDKENVSVDMELEGIIPARLSPLKLLQKSIRKEQECKYHPKNSSFWFSWNCLQRKTTPWQRCLHQEQNPAEHCCPLGLFAIGDVGLCSDMPRKAQDASRAGAVGATFAEAYQVLLAACALPAPSPRQ